MLLISVEIRSSLKKSSVTSSEEFDEWVLLDKKTVLDYDGFLTDYTLWTDGTTFVCIFGDSDYYTPDTADPDFETDNESDAYEWFRSYEGFEDELDEI